MSADPWPDVQLLAEPTRRRVYEAVRVARESVTRDDVAATAEISRRLAAFHLDLLAEAGLLAVDFARPAGRSGPGAGRPAKRYRATDREVQLSVPERRYDLAARVFAAGIRDAGDGGDARARALDAARAEGLRVGELHRTGRRIGAAKTLARAAQALEEIGYEPAYDDARSVRLANCPFHGVVDVAPGLVCGMNERFIDGLLEGLDGDPQVVASLAPCPPDCCVRVQVGPATA